VFRGDVAQRELVAFRPDRGRVVAGMNVNTWGVRDAITTIITARRPVDVRQLLDSTIPLGMIVAA
jgi:3-phenylpropionate/trans-cinnamate dioxygenase ferredoxin reductase subunit